jgi:hypothetical protein
MYGQSLHSAQYRRKISRKSRKAAKLKPIRNSRKNAQKAQKISHKTTKTQSPEIAAKEHKERKNYCKQNRLKSQINPPSQSFFFAILAFFRGYSVFFFLLRFLRLFAAIPSRLSASR